MIITRFFFVGNSTKKRVTWCDEDSLPSFVASMSTRNQFILWGTMNAERTTSVKNILCRIVKNSSKHPSTQGQWVFHQKVLELLVSKPRIFWNAQHSTLVLLLPSCISRSQYFSEKSRAPCFANAFSNTSLIVSQCIGRQIVVHLDRNDAPFSLPFWRPVLTELLRTKNWLE